MKQALIASISAVALLAGTPCGARSDQLYQIPDRGKDFTLSLVSETTRREGRESILISQNGAVQLRLDAQKRVAVRDGQGKEQVSWETLNADAPVQPGDIIRYVQSLNASRQRQVKNLVLTQPIPPRTVYILNSAAGAGTVTITYSTDRGKTYSASPEIEVRQTDGRVVRQPAAAANYTHIRWKFSEVTAPAERIATFQVAVK